MDPIQIIVLVLLGAVFHIALGILALRFNAAALLLGAFIFLSALSGMADLPFIEQTKYGRLYVQLLLVAIGVLFYRVFVPKPTLAIYLCFAIFYVIAAFWSPMPIQGFLFKGLLLLSLACGAIAAYTVKSAVDYQSMVRILLFAGLGLVSVLMAAFVFNPSSISHIGRFEPWGLNPNRVGHTVGPIGIICAYVILYDKSKIMRGIALALAFPIGLTILLTASRGAAGLLVLGSFIVGIPYLKNPVATGAILGVVSAMGAVLLSFFSNEQTERLQEADLQSREGVWHNGYAMFQDNPVFGGGWAFTQTTGANSATTANFHSMYFQALGETGLVGLALLLLCVVISLLMSLRTIAVVRASSLPMHYAFLPVALVIAIFAHGAFESATITGSSVTGVMLGFGLALLDQVVTVARNEDAWAEEHGDWDEEYDEHEGYDRLVDPEFAANY